MILITGGAGFIGSNLASHFTGSGLEVVICDHLGDDNIKWKNISKHLIDRVVPPAALADFLQKDGATVDAVIHMGAISATTARDADEIVKTNFDLTRFLWSWCSSRKVPFVYASSAATYGGGEFGFEDTDDLAYHLSLRPLNLYGWSKKWFDTWALNEVAKGRAQPPVWAGLKFFNVYGPNELHKQDMMSVVAKASDKCAAGETVTLFKSHNPEYQDGGQLRDFVYVDDCINVVSWLLAGSAASGIYNVGSGIARSFKDLISIAFRAAGNAPNIHYVDMPIEIRDRYQYFTQANLSKLIERGYPHKPTTLEIGVTKYMKEFLLTKDPFR